MSCIPCRCLGRKNGLASCCAVASQSTKKTATSDFVCPLPHFRSCSYFPVALNDSPFSAADGAAIIAPSNSAARKRHVTRTIPDSRCAGIRPVFSHSRTVRCATFRYAAASRAVSHSEVGVMLIVNFEAAAFIRSYSREPLGSWESSHSNFLVSLAKSMCAPSGTLFLCASWR